MTFKITANQPNFYDNRVDALKTEQTNVSPSSDAKPEVYPGSSLKVEVFKEDTQRDFVHRGLYKHAEAAGLPHDESVKFAEKWTTDKLFHQAGGTTRAYTAKEFAQLKAKGASNFDLDERYSPDALNDLRQRQTDYAASQRTIQNSTPSMSAAQFSDAERAVKWMTDTVDQITGSENEVGKQLNRFSISGLRLMGQLQDLRNKATETLTDAVRSVAPAAVDDFLNRVDETNRETAQALKNARSVVTNNDTADDLRAAKAGIKRPLAEDLHRKLMYFPEAIPNAIDSAIKGDFKADDGSYSDKVGKIIGGLNPAGDVRDIVANGKQLIETGDPKKLIPLGAAIVGGVPGIGDVAKPIIKEVGEELLEKTAKEAAEKLAKEQAEQISKQINELSINGHGPQRHGSRVTEQQLDERAMYGKDPVTGTTDDAYLKNSDGTPKKHAYSKDATKIVSDADYVKGAEFMRNTQQFKDKLANAEANSLTKFEVENVKLETIYGTDYKNVVFGKTRQGTKNNPTGTTSTDFTDGTMISVYKKGDDGKWSLLTMFPKPKE